MAPPSVLKKRRHSEISQPLQSNSAEKGMHGPVRKKNRASKPLQSTEGKQKENKDVGSAKGKQKENKDVGSVKGKQKENKDVGSAKGKQKENKDVGSANKKEQDAWLYLDLPESDFEEYAFGLDKMYMRNFIKTYEVLSIPPILEEQEINQEVMERKNDVTQEDETKMSASSYSGRSYSTRVAWKKLLTQKPRGVKEDEIWFPENSSPSRYQLLCSIKWERIIKFSQLLLERQDIRNASCSNVIKNLQNESILRSMPLAIAKERVEFAIQTSSSWDRCYKHIELVNCLLQYPSLTIKSDYVILCNHCDKCGIEKQDFYRVHEKTADKVQKIIKRDASILRRECVQLSKDIHPECPENVIRKVVLEKISSQAYQAAFGIVQLHQEFDRHLVSFHDDLVNDKRRKIEDLMRDENVVPDKFKTLDESLIKASLRFRVRYLKKIDEFKRYVVWLKPFVELKVKECHSILDDVLDGVRKDCPDFPNLSQGCILNEESEEFSTFLEQLSKIERLTGPVSVSRSYVLDGILFYLDISSRLPGMERSLKLISRFEDACKFRLRCLEKVWGKRHYEHHAYTTLFDDPWLVF